MDRMRSSAGWWRGVCMTLAALALVVKIAVPTGFMVADARANAFPLVLCTAQGAVVLDSGHAAPDGPKAPKSHESPCAFAGHGAAYVAPALASDAVVQVVSYEIFSPSASPRLAPCRGLVAPPPPARGPPLTA